jgi:hypothetical protein
MAIKGSLCRILLSRETDDARFKIPQERPALRLAGVPIHPGPYYPLPDLHDPGISGLEATVTFFDLEDEPIHRPGRGLSDWEEEEEKDYEGGDEI